MDEGIAVVKIGSSSLATADGELSLPKMRRIVRQIAYMRRRGMRVVVISSGAVACGYRLLGLNTRPQSVKEKQAAAAVGQGILIEHYRQSFNDYGVEVAQVLLTRSDFSDRERCGNAFHTINLLLTRGIVPIINENDSVSTAEIRWGDNDFLAAQTAGFLQACWLILATTADGLYTKDPVRDAEAKPIPYLDTVSDSLLASLGSTRSKYGTGGMRSKLQAARYASSLGVKVYIGRAGAAETWLADVVAGDGTGTYVGADIDPDESSHAPTPGRKRQWIAYLSQVKGRLVVDAGAAYVLKRGHASLLPCGVVRVEGEFRAGDVVEVAGECGEPFGRGVVNYAASVLRQVKGLQTQEIVRRLPEQAAEVIHRDNWVHVLKMRPAKERV
ncbi:glutamate 5-kinase [Numidum massiliense]|uniref:glutamate 5-kinase n=1 Tax=Numidum massiliense TaxID=1522315 RepID=UPI0006D56C8F|nr:glutamate 5-kinase [Numidum massiliense]